MELTPIFNHQSLNSDWQSFFKNSREELRKAEEAEEKVNNKTDKEIDQAGLSEIIRELVKIIEAMDDKFTKAIEQIIERLDEIQEIQSQRPIGRAPVEKSELSQRDIKILESQIEQLGLIGEIRRQRPFEFIRGKFIEKP